MSPTHLLAALLAVTASAATVKNSPAMDYVLGFTLGLESVIGNPSDCIGDIAKISSACKSPKDVNGGDSCMSAISELMDACGFKQITFGRLQELTQNPINYLQARAKLLLGNPELREDLEQAQSLCAQQEYSSCGVFSGKFVGLLVSAPAEPLPEATDSAWLIYVLIIFGAAAIAACIWHLVTSTMAFVSDISRPCCKLLLVLVLWILLILLVNKLNLADYEAVQEVLADVVSTAKGAAKEAAM